MKKRTILAFIITVIVIIAINRSWFVFEPISVDFDILSKGKHNIEVQLNKKNDDEFKKIKKEDADFDLDETNKFTLSIKRAKKPKKIRIIISCNGNSNLITIKKIQINNVELDNLKKMDVLGADVLNGKNQELVLKPESDTVILTYPETLKTKARIKFNFELFIIISILTFLFAYKLTNYSAEFNTIYKKSKIEIIFLSIFFIFLFVPMSYIDNRAISKKENRTLAKLAPLVDKEGQVNFNFTKSFDAWFNDRFNLRENFIEFYNKKFIINKNWKTKDVLKGKDNWLFLGWQESRTSYTNQNLFPQDELKKLADYLSSIDTYCKKNNKHFYFLITPDKARIYPEYYPDDIKPVGSMSLAQQIVEYLNKNTNVKVIYPKDKLISKKGDELLYFKQDTHWTPLGAYIAYLELMKEIKKDYKDINIYEAKNYIKKDNVGDLYNMTLKSLRKKDTTLYKMPDINNESLCKQNIKNSDELITCFNDKNPNINLVSYRDSFTTSLVSYYCESFRSARYLWKYDVNLDSLKEADVVILEVVERLIPKILNAVEENNYAV